MGTRICCRGPTTPQSGEDIDEPIDCPTRPVDQIRAARADLAGGHRIDGTACRGDRLDDVARPVAARDQGRRGSGDHRGCDGRGTGAASRGGQRRRTRSAVPSSAPTRAAPQADRHRAADRAPDRPVDAVSDQFESKSETADREQPAPTARPVETPLAASPPEPSAVALLQAPPPPPAKPAPPVPTPAALTPARPTLPGPQSETANGTDARSAPARDGIEASTDTDAHRGGTKGASPRGDNPKPEYPFVARNRGYQGRVVLQVDVLPDGTAGGVELTSSSGYDSLDAAAVRTVRQWRFVPARRNGRPVAAAVTVPVLFKLY